MRAAAVKKNPGRLSFWTTSGPAKNITDRIWPVVMARALKMRTQLSIPVSNGGLMWINREYVRRKGAETCGPRPPNDSKGSLARQCAYATARGSCFDHTRAALS